MKKFTQILTALVLLSGQTVFAQELKTSYFLDDRNVYQYRINPAAMPNEGTTGYLGLLINDINIGTKTNLGISKLVFPYNGELVWGLNKNIPAQQFLSGLKNNNRAQFELGYSILTVGTKLRNGFLSFDLNIKDNAYVSIPKSLFATLKEGNKGQIYNIGGMSLDETGYIELAANYSRRINSQFSIGVGLKVLAGVANLYANIKDAQVMLNDQISVSGNGQVNASLAGAEIPIDKNGMFNFQALNFNDIKPAGFGAAIDLGVRWNTPVEGLSVDAAIINLGGIAWSGVHTGELSANGQVNSKDVDIWEILQFKAVGNVGNKFKMLPVTVNAGAKYIMPFYSRMSAGILGSFNFSSISSYDIRMGVNVTPINAIGLAVSGGVNTHGAVLGAAINFRIPGINLFTGVDGFVTNFTPQFIPVNPVNTLYKFGLTIVFGNNR